MTKQEAMQRINDIHSEIERLKSEESDLVRYINDIDYYNMVYSVSKDNSMHFHLYKDTATTRLMDRYYKSDKEFLIFSDVCCISSESYDEWKWKRVSLIIQKTMPRKTVKNNGLTMTDLKKEETIYVFERGDFLSNRFSSLRDEILNTIKRVTKPDKIFPFENPVRLGGQIYANQTGFGSEYNGDTLVYQGTLYGETTSFYIVGFMIS